MLRTLLICGLIAGACAGVLGFGFARLAGEAPLDAAIHFEERGEPAGPGKPLVTRRTQRGFGLLTATLVYGVALGGIFALVFAGAYGRVARASPARTALSLAAVAFLVLFLVPFVKYPASPPGAVDPETIRPRTMLYGTMLLASLLSAVAGVRLRALLLRSRRWSAYATPVAVAAYTALVAVVMLILPGIGEVPADFPVATLQAFRAAAVGLQLTVWTTIGVVFAVLARWRMTRATSGAPPRSGAPAEVERA